MVAVPKNGSGGWFQWSLGIVLAIFVLWLSAVTAMTQNNTPKTWTIALESRIMADVLQSEGRLDDRLDRIENKLDRLIERSGP